MSVQEIEPFGFSRAISLCVCKRNKKNLFCCEFVFFGMPLSWRERTRKNTLRFVSYVFSDHLSLSISPSLLVCSSTHLTVLNLCVSFTVYKLNRAQAAHLKRSRFASLSHVCLSRLEMPCVDDNPK